VRESKVRVIALGCLVAWSTVGCTRDQAPPVISESDSAGVRIVTSDRPLEEWTLHADPELELGAAETGGPTEFFQVEAARFLPANRFVVVNRSTEELRFFDEDGGFVGSMGGEGHGPEEFRGLSWLEVLGDSLLTYDSGNDRLSVRDFSGAFGRTFRLEWASGLLVPLAVLHDATILSLSARHMAESAQAGTQVDVGLVSRHDLDGATLDSVRHFPVRERVVHREGNVQTTIGLPLSASAGFSAWKQGFCYVFGPEFQVECFDAVGTLKTIMRVAAAPRILRSENVDDAFNHELDRAREARNQAREQALLTARPSMTFPETLPAFTDILIDDRDRVWIRKYELPGSEAVEWWVFDEGRWAGRLTIDFRFQVMDASGDRILGVWRDDMGIEEIRVHRFGPSTRP
jgi:hypothetical protein